MFISCFFNFALLVKYPYGVSSIPAPLNIIDSAMKEIHKVVQPEIFFGKVPSGIFDIEKGIVDGINKVIGKPVDLERLTFHLVTAENVRNPSRIAYFKPEDVAQTEGKIIFLIHGWRKSMNSSWYKDLSEILIMKDPDTHVVEVNWNLNAASNYAFAAFSTETSGEYVGTFINILVTQHKVSLENIIVIGHSLGGQISGWASKTLMRQTGRKLSRIIALDPAGPLFIHRPESRRLNKDDADVVMVVHTDADKLGFPYPCGTIDFFPNGGNNQPGCWTMNLTQISSYGKPVTCDHSRAWQFFVEAVNNTGSFLGRKCARLWYSENEECVDEVVAMGDLTTTAKGSFYLETNSQSPFSKPLPELENKNDAIKNVKCFLRKSIDPNIFNNCTFLL